MRLKELIDAYPNGSPSRCLLCGFLPVAFVGTAALSTFAIPRQFAQIGCSARGLLNPMNRCQAASLSDGLKYLKYFRMFSTTSLQDQTSNQHR